MVSRKSALAALALLGLACAQELPVDDACSPGDEDCALSLRQLRAHESAGVQGACKKGSITKKQLTKHGETCSKKYVFSFGRANKVKNTAACWTSAVGATGACVSCLADFSACGVGACMGKCLGKSQSDACTGCMESSCGGKFEKCTGLSKKDLGPGLLEAAAEEVEEEGTEAEELITDEMQEEYLEHMQELHLMEIFGRAMADERSETDAEEEFSTTGKCSKKVDEAWLKKHAGNCGIKGLGFGSATKKLAKVRNCFDTQEATSESSACRACLADFAYCGATNCGFTCKMSPEGSGCKSCMLKNGCDAKIKNC